MRNIGIFIVVSLCLSACTNLPEKRFPEFVQESQDRDIGVVLDLTMVRDIEGGKGGLHFTSH